MPLHNLQRNLWLTSFSPMSRNRLHESETDAGEDLDFSRVPLYISFTHVRSVAFSH